MSLLFYSKGVMLGGLVNLNVNLGNISKRKILTSKIVCVSFFVFCFVI